MIVSADHVTLDQWKARKSALNHLMHTFLPQSVH
jgi:hypothetical protein